MLRIRHARTARTLLGFSPTERVTRVGNPARDVRSCGEYGYAAPASYSYFIPEDVRGLCTSGTGAACVAKSWHAAPFASFKQVFT